MTVFGLSGLREKRDWEEKRGNERKEEICLSVSGSGSASLYVSPYLSPYLSLSLSYLWAGGGELENFILNPIGSIRGSHSSRRELK
jgi:hypothetical protein